MAIDFDQRDGWIWMNGKTVEWKQAQSHVMTHALHYGGSVFEGIRVYNGKIFKLREHMERLFKSAEIIGAPIVNFTLNEICDAAEMIIKKNDLTDGYIRPLAWRGAQEMGIGATSCVTEVMIACWVWPKYFGEGQGITLKTSTWKKPDPQTAVTASKCAALYVVNTLAKHEAVKAGYGDALMLDYRGFVAEVSAANIFMVKDGKVSTPIADCFLNGITRLTVIDLCKIHGIEVTERRITPEELLNADEIFLTGTAVEIVPILKIDNTDFKIGPVTQKIGALYTQMTGQAS